MVLRIEPPCYRYIGNIFSQVFNPRILSLCIDIQAFILPTDCTIRLIETTLIHDRSLMNGNDVIFYISIKVQAIKMAIRAKADLTCCQGYMTLRII